MAYVYEKAVLIGATALLPMTAQAYIDPGTGSMLLQMGLAAVAGALFYVRQVRSTVTDWFRRSVLRRPSEVPFTVDNESGK